MDILWVSAYCPIVPYLRHAHFSNFRVTRFVQRHPSSPFTISIISPIYLDVNSNRAIVDANGIGAIALTIQERAQQARLALPSFAQEKNPRLPHRCAPLRPQLPQVREDKQPALAQDLVRNLHVERDGSRLHALQLQRTEQSLCSENRTDQTIGSSGIGSLSCHD